MKLKYLCVCSGISAPTMAWRDKDWECLAYAEVDPFASAVLAYRYGAGRPRFMPDPAEAGLDPKEAKRRAAAIRALDRIEWGTKVRNEGDFTKLIDEPWIVEADILVGGTPCQDFSLAGLRAGITGQRGNLTLEFIRLANAIDDLRRAARLPPLIVLWENVPGIFSSGRAFNSFMGGMVGSDTALVQPGKRNWPNAGVAVGPQRTAAYRVLDSQFFGPPQRRRRVFVLAVGHPGAWVVADALLSIRHSLRRHPAPSRTPRQEHAGSPGAGARSGGGGPDQSDGRGAGGAGGGGGPDRGGLGRGDPVLGGVARTLNAHGGPHGRQDVSTETLIPVAGTIDAASGRSRGAGTNPGMLVAQPIPFDTAQITHPENRSKPEQGDPSPTLNARGHAPSIAFHGAVNIEHGLAPHGSLALSDVVPELTASEGKGHTAIAFRTDQTGSNGLNIQEGVAFPLDRGTPQGVLHASEVSPTITAQFGEQTGQDSKNGALVVVHADQIAGPLLSTTQGGGQRTTAVEGNPLVAYSSEVAPALTQTPYRDRGAEEGALVATAFSMRGRDGENMPEAEPGDVAPALRTGDGGSSKPFIAYAFKASHFTRDKDGAPSEVYPRLSADADKGDQDPLVFIGPAYAFSGKNDGGDAGENVAPTLRAMGHDGSHANAGGQVSVSYAAEVAGTLRSASESPAAHGKLNGTDRNELVAAPRVFSVMPMNSNTDFVGREVDVVQPILAGGPVSGAQGGDYVLQPPAEAFNISPGDQGYSALPTEVAATISASGEESKNGRGTHVVGGAAVRRLTPRECERLQDFPDDFTLIPYGDARRDEQDREETVLYLRAYGYGDNEARALADSPDGPRYRVLGNTMNVAVIRWLGDRIAWAHAERARRMGWA